MNANRVTILLCFLLLGSRTGKLTDRGGILRERKDFWEFTCSLEIKNPREVRSLRIEREKRDFEKRRVFEKLKCPFVVVGFMSTQFALCA